MRDRVPNMEYVFCDTEKELPETYAYLDNLEVFLGRRIKKIKPEVSFDDLLKIKGNFLPSPQVRWCTEYLKLKPFEREIGDAPVVMYIGIRADEPDRQGYVSTKPNIKARFPFVEDGLVLADIIRILEESGLGLPDYYKWRSRSGCYFCFYQQRREWVGLWENHPEKFREAAAYERHDPETGELYTWIQGIRLTDLVASEETIDAIKQDYQRRVERSKVAPGNQTLSSIFGSCSIAGDESGICRL
jgi:3'-phosphoadenosine 5'-phosphosulfate sulfotransferase (PAPS reductase)/FAD synthetase